MKILRTKLFRYLNPKEIVTFAKRRNKLVHLIKTNNPKAREYASNLALDISKVTGRNVNNLGGMRLENFRNKTKSLKNTALDTQLAISFDGYSKGTLENKPKKEVIRKPIAKILLPNKQKRATKELAVNTAGKISNSKVYPGAQLEIKQAPQQLKLFTTMKILREKIFFDYKGYADKYGDKAAQEIKDARNGIAREIMSHRSINTESAKVAKDAMQLLDPNNPADKAAYEASKKVLESTKDKSLEKLTLRHGKEKLKRLETIHQNNRADVEESIKHHNTVAQNLRKKKQRGERLNKVGEWIKENPGKSAAIGLGAAALGTAGYAAYKHYKNKKNKSDKKDKD